MKSLIFFTSVGLCLNLSCSAGEEIIKDTQGMDCYVYTPDPIDPAKTYQLIVGVHGAGGPNGKGAAGMKGWASRGDVIVIGPAFQTKGQRPYQNGDGPHAEKLIALFKELQGKYKLRDEMFLHGFSGGSQFVHRFAMLHPDVVCGVSAHSGGSWATDGFGTISSKAKKIPFAISCGEKDTGKAWGDAKFNRLDWFKRFRDEIDKKGFCYIAKAWPDVGHRNSGGAWDLCQQCFQVSTGLPGKSATEKVEISSEWKNLEKAPKHERSSSNGIRAPYVDPNELARMTKAAFARADQEEISNAQLINFMTRYPPSLWKEQKGSEQLLNQCSRAAVDWRDRAMKANAFVGANLKHFQAFTNGLELPPPTP